MKLFLTLAVCTAFLTAPAVAQKGGSANQGAAEIKQFCSRDYKVSFPLFSKIVAKGNKIHPLYEFLTSETTNPKFAGEIPWNFTKFLVNRKGEVIARYHPKVTPSTASVTGAIEKALSDK